MVIAWRAFLLSHNALCEGHCCSRQSVCQDLARLPPTNLHRMRRCQPYSPHQARVNKHALRESRASLLARVERQMCLLDLREHGSSGTAPLITLWRSMGLAFLTLDFDRHVRGHTFFLIRRLHSGTSQLLACAVVPLECCVLLRLYPDVS